MADILNNGATLPQLNNTQVVGNLDLRELMIERGTTGLRRAGGFIGEESLRELQGSQALRTYKEMRDNSPVVGACLYAVEFLMRKVPWRLDPADDSTLCAEYADFVDGMLFRDLDMPWSMLISEILSFLPFGWSWFELIFKQRQGQQPAMGDDGRPALSSLFDDGMIGLGKIAPRAQDTLLRWEFDQTGTLMGMHQMDSYVGRQAYLPYEKCALFRPTSWKDSPESRSILRTAYRSWYLLKHLENMEGIGYERDATGIPSIGTPPQWWGAGASDEQVAQLEVMKRIGRNLRNDEQACLVYPLLYDQQNNPLLKIELLASPGTKAMDIDKSIQRYELRITQSMLCDLIFVGHEAVGSFALASSKTNLLSMALSGYLMAIADVFNRRIIPMIWRLNSLPEDCRPTLTHGDVESVDLTELGTFIKDYSGAGFETADLENHVRTLAEFPERDEEAIAAAHAAKMERAAAMAEATAPPVPETPPTPPRQPVEKRRVVVPPRRALWRGYGSLVAKHG